MRVKKIEHPNTRQGRLDTRGVGRKKTKKTQ